MILSDPNMMATADMTTKEILKKYGDIAKLSASTKHHHKLPPPPRNKDGRPPQAVLHSVPGEVGEREAWSSNNTVRQVQTPPAPEPHHPMYANENGNHSSHVHGQPSHGGQRFSFDEGTPSGAPGGGYGGASRQNSDLSAHAG